jgi:hypothetical protein
MDGMDHGSPVVFVDLEILKVSCVSMDDYCIVVELTVSTGVYGQIYLMLLPMMLMLPLLSLILLLVLMLPLLPMMLIMWATITDVDDGDMLSWVCLLACSINFGATYHGYDLCDGC